MVSARMCGAVTPCGCISTAPASGSRVDKKLTLAQTPSGPQVWDWVGQGFLPGATLAWREVPGGYQYEAAFPWPSLNRQDASAGTRLGFESGLGFAGGFIDWTGTDPDTASNLAPLTLVETLAEAPPNVARDPRPEAVAVRVELDGQPVATLPERVSPDRDYLWLDRIGGPLELASGEHEILRLVRGPGLRGRERRRRVLADPATDRARLGTLRWLDCRAEV